MKTSICFFCCVIAAGLVGCGKNGATVANIGKSKITLKTLEERIMDAPPAYQSYLTTAAGRKQFLDLIVREHIVIEAAKKAGVSKKPEYKRRIWQRNSENMKKAC